MMANPDGRHWLNDGAGLKERIDGRCFLPERGGDHPAETHGQDGAYDQSRLQCHHFILLSI